MYACPICRATLNAHGTCPRDGATPDSAPADPRPPSLAAQYRIERPFARGDTGTLYVARDAGSGAIGLLKVLRLREDASRAAREALRRTLGRQGELASASASLLVPRRCGETDGLVWCFRDYVAGDSLRTLAATGAEPALGDALVMVAQVASALEKLHERGLFHGAVRPGHVIVRRDGELPLAVLIDAAMVGERKAGSAFDDLGDVFYMSPEQASDQPVTLRSDLYSLGCLLFDLLTGNAPFDGETAQDVMRAHLSTAPAIPTEGVPGPISALLTSMLGKAPRTRPSSARAVVRALEPFLPEGWNAGLEQAAAGPRAEPPPALQAIRRARMPPPPEAPEAGPPPAAVAPAVPPPAARVPASPPAPRPVPATISGSFRMDSGEIALTPVRRMDPPSIKLTLDASPDEGHGAAPRRRRRPRRLVWLALGLVLGHLGTAAALWLAATTGHYPAVTDALSTHLGVPIQKLAPRGFAPPSPTPPTPPVATPPAPIAAPPPATPDAGPADAGPATRDAGPSAGDAGQTAASARPAAPSAPSPRRAKARRSRNRPPRRPTSDLML